MYRFFFVKFSRTSRADPKITNEGQVTCLHFAAAQGDKDGIQKVLNLGTV